MGEFESVRPAVETPMPKAKSSLGLKIACGFFAAATVGLAAFVALDKTGVIGEKTKTEAPEQGEQAKCVSEGGDQIKTESAQLGFVWSSSTINGAGSFYVTKTGDVYFVPTSVWAEGSTAKKENWSMAFTDSAYLPGTLTTVTLTQDDIAEEVYDMDFWPNEDGTKREAKLVLENAYKIDVSDIVAIHEVWFGNGFSAYNYALIDSQGNINWLYVRPGNLPNETKSAHAKLTKNVSGYSDIASLMSVNIQDGISVMVVYKDGTQALMPFELLDDLTIDPGVYATN